MVSFTSLVIVVLLLDRDLARSGSAEASCSVWVVYFMSERFNSR